MDRRTQIERTIIGTLIADFEGHWPEVKTAIWPAMMHDPLCQRTLERIGRMARQGQGVDIATITDHGRLPDTMALMRMACNDDFHLQQYNYRTGCIIERQPYMHVTFEMYIDQFIKHEIQRQKSQQVIR